MSLVCFLSGVLLYFYASPWRAESRYESVKASYASIQQGLKANAASLSKEHAAIMAEAVESAERDVDRSKQLLRLTLVEAPVAFLIYYTALLLLSWSVGQFRSSSQAEQPPADPIAGAEPENPSFLARACMILTLAIGAEGLDIHLYRSGGGMMYGLDVTWALINLGASVAACILYYLVKGLPRGADLGFAKSILGPSFFWCIIPTLSILTRLALLGRPK